MGKLKSKIKAELQAKLLVKENLNFGSLSRKFKNVNSLRMLDYILMHKITNSSLKNLQDLIQQKQCIIKQLQWLIDLESKKLDSI